MTIQEAVDSFKKLIEDSILEGGEKAKQAMIRSSRPILNIHEAVKAELVRLNIPQDFIFPPLNARTPELKLAGSRKQKNQDICVVPDMDKTQEILEDGLLHDVIDEFGERYTERTISINVRSQISSIQKNFDTLYERTTSEATNLHDRCPKMCLGEVYMIAVPEYDDKSIRQNKIVFKRPNPALVLKYIKSFQAINNRKGFEKNFYKYEKVCLLIVDFSKTPATIYNTNEELIKEGLLPQESGVDISELSWNSFMQELLQAYAERFERGMDN